jgi:DNA-binding transcriptional regulator YhcF (GntR family)
MWKFEVFQGFFMGVRLSLQPKHRHLSNQLRQRLIVENRSPGDRFLTVREIAKAYSVSLVTAHQSVQELAADNVLTVRPYKGCFVGEGLRAVRDSTSRPLITIFASESLYASGGTLPPEGYVRGLRASVPTARLRMEYLPLEGAIPFLEGYVSANEAQPDAHAYVLRSVDLTIKRFFAERGLQAVVDGNLEAGIHLPSVQRDERQIAYSVTQFVLSKGHKKIAFVEWDAPLEGHACRRDGYAAALREANVASSLIEAEQRIVRLPITEQPLVQAVRGMLSSDDRPTAILFGQEQHAAWTIRTARDMQLDIPSDLSLVALAGGTLSDHLSPRLTMVPRKDYENGAAVGHYLASLLKGEPLTDEKYLLFATLVEGETT